MKVYIARHGTTVWNEKRITQGYFRNRLSEKGKQEVEQAALKIKNSKIDAIYVSPVFRVVQSANIFNKYHNVKVIKDDKLIGINQGVFAGRFWDTLTEEEIRLHNTRDPQTGMESYRSVYKRTREFVDDLLKNNKYENILIVTHNTNATALTYLLTNTKVDFDDIKSMNIFSCADVKEVEVKTR